jgi:hypothetical protein
MHEEGEHSAILSAKGVVLVMVLAAKKISAVSSMKKQERCG